MQYWRCSYSWQIGHWHMTCKCRLTRLLPLNLDLGRRIYEIISVVTTTNRIASALNYHAIQYIYLNTYLQ